MTGRVRRPTNGSIVAQSRPVLESGMVQNCHSVVAKERAIRIVLDDRSRLPWRFFGRLTTAALAA
jgi:hypothetical protein